MKKLVLLLSMLMLITASAIPQTKVSIEPPSVWKEPTFGQVFYFYKNQWLANFVEDTTLRINTKKYDYFSYNQDTVFCRHDTDRYVHNRWESKITLYYRTADPAKWLWYIGSDSVLGIPSSVTRTLDSTFRLTQYCPQMGLTWRTSSLDSMLLNRRWPIFATASGRLWVLMWIEKVTGTGTTKTSYIHVAFHDPIPSWFLALGDSLRSTALPRPIMPPLPPTDTTSIPAPPAIQVTPLSLTFTNNLGLYSPVQTLQVTGIRTIASITVTAPARFSISSLATGPWGTTLALLFPANLNPQVVYARFDGSALGTVVDTIRCSTPSTSGTVSGYGVAVRGTTSSVPSTSYLAHFAAGDAVLTAPTVINIVGGVSYFTTPTANTGTAAFTINIPNVTAPYFFIWCKVLGVDGSNDSYFVNVDGDEQIFDVAEGKWSPNWQWSQLTMRDPSGALTSAGYMVELVRRFSLTAGGHVLTFRGREVGAKCSEVYVTSDSLYVPGP